MYIKYLILGADESIGLLCIVWDFCVFWSLQDGDLGETHARDPLLAAGIIFLSFLHLMNGIVLPALTVLESRFGNFLFTPEFVLGKSEAIGFLFFQTGFLAKNVSFLASIP